MNFQDIAYPKRYVRVIKGEYAGKEFEVIAEHYSRGYLEVDSGLKDKNSNQTTGIQRSYCVDLTPVMFTKDGVTRKIAVGDEVLYAKNQYKVVQANWYPNTEEWNLFVLSSDLQDWQTLTADDIDDHYPIGITDDPKEKWLEEGRKNGWVEKELPKDIIDTNADPFIPYDWKIEEHKKMGQFTFDSSKIDFYLTQEQKDGETIKGNELKKKLKGKNVLNANVLDYLLAHTKLIPESWKKDEQGKIRFIYFWGTIYRDGGGYLRVRGLCFGRGQWRWDCSCLDGGFGGQSPAAVSAST